MPMLRLALILMVFLLLSVAGTAGAHARHGVEQQVHSSSPSAAASVEIRMTSVAVVDSDDADCDGDGCRDGHCRHHCACGCGMGSCASPSGALVALPWTFRWIDSSEPIALFLAQLPAAARGASPLRPPIA